MDKVVSVHWRKCARLLLYELNDLKTVKNALTKLFPETSSDASLYILTQILLWQQSSFNTVQDTISAFHCNSQEELDAIAIDSKLTLEFLMEQIQSDMIFLALGKPVLQYATSIYDEELSFQIWNSMLNYQSIVPKFNLIRQAVSNSMDAHGYSPLHYAIDAQMVDFIPSFCNEIKKKRIQESTWFNSILFSNITTRDVVLPITSAQIRGSDITSGGCNLLHFASMKGEFQILKALLSLPHSLGLALEQKNWDGHTPLMLAKLWKRQDIVTYLQSAEVDVNGTVAEAISDLDVVSLQNSHDLQAIQRFRASMHVSDIMKEPIISNDCIWPQCECNEILMLLNKAVDAIGWCTQRHGSYPTTDLPLHNAIPMEYWIKNSLQERLFPVIYKKYCIDSLENKILFRELFFVKYEVPVTKYCADDRCDSSNTTFAQTTECQNELPLHCDGSILSFNILLNSPDEFEGGGTYFEDLDTTYYISQGHAVVHSGKVRHAGARVTSGKRLILVGFLDLVHTCEVA